MDNYILMENKESISFTPFPLEVVGDVMRFKLLKNSKFGGIISRIEKELQVGMVVTFHCCTIFFFVKVFKIFN